MSVSELTPIQDSAFLDRIDFKLNIPTPNASMCADILRRGYLDIPVGYLSPAPNAPYDLSAPPPPQIEETPRPGRTPGPHFHADGSRANSFAYLKAAVAAQLLPPDTALLRFGPAAPHPAVALWRLARRCTDLSARALERLPLLSLVQRDAADAWPCPLDEALAALERVVEQEVAVVRKRGRQLGDSADAQVADHADGSGEKKTAQAAWGSSKE